MGNARATKKVSANRRLENRTDLKAGKKEQ
jgi:hypothetical protein